MPQSDVREIDSQEGRVAKKRRFDKRDFDTIAEYVIEEWSRRKHKRGDLEKQWADIDRQLRMEPDTAYKKVPGSDKVDPNKAWMAEMELPLQAQALEVLTADSRRMMFPAGEAWFRAHALVSDEYLERADFAALISNDELEVPSRITQDNADKLVEGWLNHFHRQYDFQGHYDKINAEAFKYGIGVGRGRLATKQTFRLTASGTVKDTQRIPVLFPRSIKSTYLDDSPHNVLNEGLVLGPAVIAVKNQVLEDLILAAANGSTDPDDEDGGWMPAATKGLMPHTDGTVTVLEYEGDLIVPRKTVRSIVIPGAIVTVVLGGKTGGNTASRGVVRFRFRKGQHSSYIVHPYHVEDLETAYAAAPLMKGRPIQIAATSALNRLMDAAALKNSPPVGYSRDDMYFAQNGGPVIHPYAMWGTTEELHVYDEVGGDPNALLQVYIGLLGQYADMTGVNAPRLGSQTLSHTTAFAKEVELSRGTVRTVDYVQAIGHGPVTQWLHAEYDLALRSIGNRTDTVWLDSYGGFVDITRSALPDKAAFDWFGAAGPAEKSRKMQERLSAAQLAIQLDQISVQLGNPPTLNLPALIQQALREGGWIDLDAIVNAEDLAAGPAAAPGLPGAAPGGGGTAVAALQALTGQGA